ncbi:MAG TPA: isochorismatase family cysteine hydrolase [Candidatus Sulfotelmatobacter sp.]|nr:isochorismatase family cysteine hydrolase [Candidatus Sulfotelmatobacter sp.]
MITVNGQQVFSTIEEIVDPRHAALVVIDAQNDFCSPGGLMANNGHDMSTMPAAIAEIGRLLETARAAGVLVIYIQNQMLPGKQSTSGAWLRFLTAKDRTTAMMDDQHCCLVDSWGAEIVDALTPLSGEIVVKKWRSSAFVGTNLDMILRVNNIKSVVCCGFITQGCVESTARDAGFYDYYPVVLEDAVANSHPELHAASLMIQRTRYDVVPSAAVRSIWERAVPQFAAAQ